MLDCGSTWKRLMAKLDTSRLKCRKFTGARMERDGCLPAAMKMKIYRKNPEDDDPSSSSRLGLHNPMSKSRIRIMNAFPLAVYGTHYSVISNIGLGNDELNGEYRTQYSVHDKKTTKNNDNKRPTTMILPNDRTQETTNIYFADR
jgi:hypothetical protein